MSLISTDYVPQSEALEHTGAVLDTFNKNALTMTGGVIAAGAAVAGGGLLLVALPVQTITAAAVAGGCVYAGHRKHEGLPIFPKFKDEEKTETATATA